MIDVSIRMNGKSLRLHSYFVGIVHVSFPKVLTKHKTSCYIIAYFSVFMETIMENGNI